MVFRRAKCSKKRKERWKIADQDSSLKTTILKVTESFSDWEYRQPL